MKLSLSVNWCNRRIESGEAIADTAAALGFDELEIGFRTTASQVEGIRRRTDTIAVGSVHAFAPAPLSAPSAHPELYSLASFDAESRSMARLQILRTAEFASGIGARTVVLHAGRISLGGFLSKLDSSTLVEKLLRGGGSSIDRSYMRLMSIARRRREDRGGVMLDLFKKELSSLVPELERLGVTLALENLPYYEAFPDEREMRCLLDEFAGAPVSAWFDTGHDYIRRQCGWQSMNVAPLKIGDVRGMHLNDVSGVEDEHLAPGFGKVDFAALKSMAEAAEHIVFEPASSVSEAELAKGVAHIRALWMN
jgi:sugar phosphate isomerase/epimerase